LKLAICVIFVLLTAFLGEVTAGGDGSSVVDIFSVVDGSWTTAALSAARIVSATSLQLLNTELVLFGGDAGTLVRKE
jgi:hypothetical protein